MADQSEKLQLFQSLLSRKYDVTLICEGKEIRASKSVLFNSCPYFIHLLSGYFPDGKGDVIKIDNTSYDVLTVVVNYASFKHFVVKDWDISKWKELFSTAHEYNFQDLLQQASEEFDINSFDLLTVLEALPLFIQLDITQVMDKLWSHVDTYADKLIDLKNRQQFLAWPQLFLEAFIQRETLNVLEVDLLDAIAEWLQKHANVEVDKILNHIHWKEISDSDSRKQSWLGWSKDTSYKDRKPRCLSAPQSFKQRFIVPDYNVAQYGASEDLLQKSDNQFAAHTYLSKDSERHQHYILLSWPFAINTIKFRLNTAHYSGYEVFVSTVDGNDYIVTPESVAGVSYQEIYFQPEIVSEIRIFSGTEVNSLECMYSSNIPALRDSYVVAQKNMIFSDMDDTTFSLRHISYLLLQKCYVSSLALYLDCDEDHQFELSDPSNAKKIRLTKLSVVKDGFLRAVILQFEEVLLYQLTVKSENGIIHIVKAECPASKSLICKANAMNSE